MRSRCAVSCSSPCAARVFIDATLSWGTLQKQGARAKRLLSNVLRSSRACARGGGVVRRRWATRAGCIFQRASSALWFSPFGVRLQLAQSRHPALVHSRGGRCLRRICFRSCGGAVLPALWSLYFQRPPRVLSATAPSLCKPLPAPRSYSSVGRRRENRAGIARASFSNSRMPLQVCRRTVPF